MAKRNILRLVTRAERAASLSVPPLDCKYRQFHSYHHRSSPNSNAAPDTILAAAYKHVPETGFTQKSILLGARDSGFLDISSSILHEGPFSLINYHLVQQRLCLGDSSKLLKDTGSQSSPDEKLIELTWARLLANKDLIHHWQEALAIMAQPSNLTVSFQELARLSDELLFLSGDKSVDYTWYTKRASLSTLYATSELFMTNDKSPRFVETRRFLARRFEESNSIRGALTSTTQWLGFTANAGLNVLRSKGVRI